MDIKKEIKLQILDMIDRMMVTGKSRLMSETQLAEKFQVSRVTIRAVLADLEYEGRIFRRHGSGTYINNTANMKTTLFHPGKLYRDVIQENGYAFSVELKSAVLRPANEEVAASLKIPLESKIFLTEKDFMADDQLAVYCMNYVDAHSVKKSDVEILTSDKYSIYQILNRIASRKGSFLSWNNTQLEATHSGRVPYLKPYKKNSDSVVPYLLLKTIYYDTNDSPLLYSVSYINTDIFKYMMIRTEANAVVREL